MTQVGEEFRLGKGYLVSRLQVLLQERRVRLPASDPEAAALISELENYQIRIPPDGNEKYGAFSVGSHDDLATALGLAVLRDLDPWQPPARPITRRDLERGDYGAFFTGDWNQW